MNIDYISFKETGYFSNLMIDYLEQKKSVQNLYNNYPSLEGIGEQMLEKRNHFSKDKRGVLCAALKQQYKGVQASDKTLKNIDALKEENVFTVVTGHQLNLFTGPFYFLYKIISTINLAKEIEGNNPECKVVPVYWMATEDHDFDEINYFNLHGKKIQWNKEVSGAVGRLSTEGLQEVYKILEQELGTSKNAKKLTSLFKKSYLEHTTLTDATRFLANELFSEYGLVIIDGDSAELKRELIPFVKKDIFENIAFKEVSKTIENIKEQPEKYNVQVNPREINYFYLKDAIRERIIEKEGNFLINNTEIKFTKEELLLELNEFPERFSPNVIARPLYQEVILPNLCYIGGGGEIAYWLELKNMFSAMQVPFPVLLLRNSALLMNEKLKGKMEKMNLSVQDLFLKQNSLINKKIREISNISIDFSEQRAHLKEQFSAMYSMAEQTDKSFYGAVKAQELKQLKGLDVLEKRLLKAQKVKLKDHVIRMADLQNELFPNFSLQERTTNFSELYVEYGSSLIVDLKNALKPLLGKFTVITMN
ncbi:bacillithiol biosynthesis cysteine-adding enzyme BshC [uncultured Maribacter sp.]|uniref:bacillithiol biosynthesis cysteine-adding enzyme BshC n=1 Tax=uncultured Maribacter sp. TaxID=431308 RepID=UPI002604DB80|nr:bacillithiol biosynthesis cysteine-adding enzyme BshC [uncultured Maribacter sp.]